MALPKINFKRILLILLFIIVVFLLGYLLYLIFFKPAAPIPPVVVVPPVITPGLPPSGPGVPVTVPTVPQVPGAPGISGIPTIPAIPTAVPQMTTQATGGLVIPATIVDANAQNVALSSNGTDLNYYDKSTGYFYKVSPDGQKTLMTDQAFKNVQTVTWAKNTQKAVLEYPDGSNIIYNFQTKQAVTLPAQWKDFDFSPDSNQLVFKDMKLDVENRWLAIADDKGQNKQLIEPLGTEDADVYPTWSPDNQTAALFRQGLDMARSKVYFVGFHGENNKSAVIEGRDIRFQWSPQGAKLLYSVYTPAADYRPTLWLTNAQGDLIDTGRTNLELNTWADKCTFADGATVYCAVPKTINQYAGLNEELNAGVGDNLYKIDLTTMTKTLIAQPIFDTPMGSILVSSDKKSLYYTNQTTGAVQKIDL